jgi:hypothetical protein
MAVARYRCTHCGNVTRFDVTRAQRTRAFYHYTVGGDLEIEEPELLDDRIEAVVCRWCESAAHVEALTDESELDEHSGAVERG